MYHVSQKYGTSKKQTHSASLSKISGLFSSSPGHFIPLSFPKNHVNMTPLFRGLSRPLAQRRAWFSSVRSVGGTIPEVQAMHTEDIDWERIYDAQEPVVLRGLVSHWPAVSGERSWSHLQRLKARISGVEDIAVRIEVGRHYMDKEIQESHVGLGSLLDYFSLPIAPGPRVYWAQFALSEEELPAMCADILTPQMCLTGKKTLYKKNIWFGGVSGSESPAHFDPFQNVLCQVLDSKTVVVFPPHCADALYPSSGTQPNTSQVDVGAPDFKRFPQYVDAQRAGQRCVLHPGDALFIPFKHWHWCRTEGVSAAVNYWWL
jgi:hypothetical protein